MNLYIKVNFGPRGLEFWLQVGLRFDPIWYLMTQPPKMSLLADLLNFVNYFFCHFRPIFTQKKPLSKKVEHPLGL